MNKKRTIVKDHLGNEYPTKVAMCEYYSINLTTFYRRISIGWTLEAALTTPVTAKENEMVVKIIDHLGNEYPTKAAMYKFYNIKKTTFEKRIGLGWTLEAALTTPAGTNCKKVYDHLGNEYLSQAAMCKFYNIKSSVFLNRIELGWTLEAALTTPVKTSNRRRKNGHIKVYDHLGHEYPSQTAMCKFYGIKQCSFLSRIKNGWTLEAALTTPIINTPARIARKKGFSKVYDHLGNEYPSQAAMCKFYGIVRNTFVKRIALGWTLEEALTVPKNMYIGEKRVMDALNKRNALYFHDVTFGYVLDVLGLDIDYEEFMEEFQSMINRETNYNWSIQKIKKLRPDFVLFRDDVNAITGVIEFDGKQHQNFIDFFFKTIEEFLSRNEADFVKNSLWEYLNIPMLRIRDDQIGLIEEMVDDFLAHPEKYLTKHNTYLSEEEYWAPLIENYGDLDIAFSF